MDEYLGRTVYHGMMRVRRHYARVRLGHWVCRRIISPIHNGRLVQADAGCAAKRRVVGRIELPTSSTLRMNHTTRPNDRPHPAPHVPLHQTLPPSHHIPTLQILSRTLSTALETHTFSHILKFPTPLTPSTAHCHPPLSTFILYFLTQTPLTPRIYPFSDSRSGMFVVVFFN